MPWLSIAGSGALAHFEHATSMKSLTQALLFNCFNSPIGFPPDTKCGAPRICAHFIPNGVAYFRLNDNSRTSVVHALIVMVLIIGA